MNSYDALLTFIEDYFQFIDSEIPYDLVPSEVATSFEGGLRDTFEKIVGGILDGELSQTLIDIVENSCFSENPEDSETERQPYREWTAWRERHEL